MKIYIIPLIAALVFVAGCASNQEPSQPLTPSEENPGNSDSIATTSSCDTVLSAADLMEIYGENVEVVDKNTPGSRAIACNYRTETHGVFFMRADFGAGVQDPTAGPDENVVAEGPEGRAYTYNTAGLQGQSAILLSNGGTVVLNHGDNDQLALVPKTDVEMFEEVLLKVWENVK